MEPNQSGRPATAAPTLDRSVLEELREYSGEEQDLAEELIELFLEESPQQLLALQSALRNADSAEVERRSHRLKGSAGSIGAMRLREICEGLESAARTSPERLAETADTEVAAELDALRKALETFPKRFA